MPKRGFKQVKRQQLKKRRKTRKQIRSVNSCESLQKKSATELDKYNRAPVNDKKTRKRNRDAFMQLSNPFCPTYKQKQAVQMAVQKPDMKKGRDGWMDTGPDMMRRVTRGRIACDSELISSVFGVARPVDARAAATPQKPKHSVPSLNKNKEKKSKSHPSSSSSSAASSSPQPDSASRPAAQLTAAQLLVLRNAPTSGLAQRLRLRGAAATQRGASVGDALGEKAAHRKTKQKRERLAARPAGTRPAATGSGAGRALAKRRKATDLTQRGVAVVQTVEGDEMDDWLDD
eukprot:Selendium_serpulae@DN67_c0_g1_i1.p1